MEVLLFYCGAIRADASTVDRLASLEKYSISAVMPQASILETEAAWLNSIKADLELLACWRGCEVRKDVAAGWRMIHLCLTWCLWLERNVRCFEDNERSFKDL